MHQDLRLRPATVADASTIVMHRRAMFEEMGYTNRAELDLMDERFVDWVAKKLTSGEYVGWFAVDQNGKITAGAGLWVMEWPPHAIDQSSKRGNILNVYTHPDYRRRGLSKRLTETILDWCHEHQVHTVILHASDAGRAIYESSGFRTTNEMRIQLPAQD